MVTHSSNLLIEDSPGEQELFRLALKQTGLEFSLFAEQDAEAAFRFLEEQAKVQGEVEWKHTGSTKPGSPTSSSTLTSTFPPLPSVILLDKGHSDRSILKDSMIADALNELDKINIEIESTKKKASEISSTT